jgi:predicted PurR-regulated permease PerM
MEHSITVNSKKNPSPPWEPGTRLISAVFLIILAGVFLYLLKSLVSLFMIAFLIAFLLFPLVLKVQGWLKSPRWLAVLLVYLLLLALIGGAGTGVGVALSQAVTSAIAGLGEFTDSIPELLEDLLNQQIVIGPWTIDLYQFDVEDVVSDIVGVIQSLLVNSGSFLASMAGRAATTVALGVSIFVFGFYLLLDFDRMGDHFVNLVPAPYQKDMRLLLKETSQLWSSFFRGQLVLGLAVGLLTILFLTILGTNFTLGLGVMAGFLELIPSFGPFISAVVGVLVALFQSSNWLGLTPFWYAVVVLGAFLLVQQLENNLLVPKIIGHSLKLPPLVVLLAILGGGYLFGLFGVLLAAPMTATLRLWIGYVYRKTVGIETWPSSMLEPRDEVRLPAPPSFLRGIAARLTGWIRSSGPLARLKDREESGELEVYGPAEAENSEE